MDRPAIHAAEDFVHAGYPLDVEALLIIELDGPVVEVDHLIGMVEAIATKNGATTCVISQSEEERMAFWAGRKAAFPAVGRISPDYLCMDGTIPRKELPKVLAGMRELSEKYGLRVANVFHAGDGNLHPLILYDANIPEELHKAEDFGADILRLCVKVGGVLTGEHGVGVEKRDLMPEMFNEIDLNQQIRVKCALMTSTCSIPARCFRNCIAVPNLAACMCIVDRCRFLTFRDSRRDHIQSSRPKTKLSKLSNGRFQSTRRSKSLVMAPNAISAALCRPSIPSALGLFGRDALRARRIGP